MKSTHHNSQRCELELKYLESCICFWVWRLGSAYHYSGCLPGDGKLLLDCEGVHPKPGSLQYIEIRTGVAVFFYYYSGIIPGRPFLHIAGRVEDFALQDMKQYCNNMHNRRALHLCRAEKYGTSHTRVSQMQHIKHTASQNNFCSFGWKFLSVYCFDKSAVCWEMTCRKILEQNVGSQLGPKQSPKNAILRHNT